MTYWDGHGGGWVFGMAIVMVLFWGSITALLWVGARALLNRPPQSGPTPRSEPHHLLEERLAQGEIEPEAFRRRLELLGGPR